MRSGQRRSQPGRGDTQRHQSSASCRFDTRRGVFDGQAILGGQAQIRVQGGQLLDRHPIGFRVGLGSPDVVGGHDHLEPVSPAKAREHQFDIERRCAAAYRDRDMGMGLVDQFDRSGDRRCAPVKKFLKHLLLLISQLGDVLVGCGQARLGKHGPYRVAVVEPDVVPEVVLVVKADPQPPADLHERLVVHGLGINYHAVEIKHDRFEHVESVGRLRWLGKAGRADRASVGGYHVRMERTASPQPLPTYEQALARVLSDVCVLESENVPLGGALGRVLGEDIVADRDQPPFNRSAMDGYAVHSAEVRAGADYQIVTTISAGAMPEPCADLTKGVARIATGASVPDAYDAVIPIEQAEETSGQVKFSLESVEQGKSIHPRGRDAMAGQVVIGRGTLLGPQHVGVAAAVGAVDISVVRRPMVSLITTGDEVRAPATPTEKLQPQQIRNSNGPMVEALLRVLGAELMDHVHVPDDPDATMSAAREALDKSDIVVTVGGVSVGRRDFLPGTWEELGLDTVVRGVAIQPGKPVFVAQTRKTPGKLVIGLPGNPVSVLATAHLFLWPVIRVVSGLSSVLPWRRVHLSHPVAPKPRREVFRSARLIGETRDEVELVAWHGSGDLAHTTQAEGLVRLKTGTQPLQAGDAVPFLPFIGGGL
jgi:molybdopterin molybdotransferase